MTSEEKGAHIFVPGLRGTVTVEVLFNACQLEVKLELAAPPSPMAVDLVLLGASACSNVGAKVSLRLGVHLC